MNKNIFTLVLFFFFSNFSFAQYTSVFKIENIETGKKNKNGNITRKIFDIICVDDYDSNNKLIHSGCYTDTSFKIKKGIHTTYDHKKLVKTVLEVINEGDIYGIASKYKNSIIDSLIFYKTIKGKTIAVLKRKVKDNEEYQILIDSLSLYPKEVPPPQPDFEKEKIDNTSNVFFAVETSAKFKGDFIKFISQNLKYPKKSKNAKIEGKVTIQFIVNIDGTIAEVVASENSICKEKELIEEAIRLIKLSSGNWEPSLMNSNKKKSYHSETIEFLLH